MSELDEDKKLIWLGLKRPESDRSEVAGGINKLLNNVEDYSTFQSDLDNVADYTEFKTYLENHGFSSEEADTFINRIQNNFEDTDSSGSTYDEFKDYVQNEASSFAELKNAFNTNKTIGSDKETTEGQKVAGIKFFDTDGYTKAGVFAPAGSTEIFGNEIHLSETGAPTAAQEDISFSNLSVSNTTPVTYERIDISADITNNGNRRGSVYVPLIEDGSVLERKKVQVAAGATETVTFERFYTELTSVEVTIKDLDPVAVVVIPAGLQIL
jgi:hypothetical protein